MRTYCIVNGDDFGAAPGINRGILEAHQKGILTSASLMVTRPAALEAAHMSRDAPRLSVGLHVVLTHEDGTPRIDLDDPEKCTAEIARQWERFNELMEQPPTHLDAHHNIYRDERLAPLFLDWAAMKNVPLREHSDVVYFPDFYGQWDGETHPEQIGVENLCRMLRTEIKPGFTEISCHPGYVDPEFRSPYSIERAIELETLCSSQVQEAVRQLGINRINYKDLSYLISKEKEFMT